MEVISTLEHPEGRMRNSELVSDSPGQYQKSFSYAEGAYEPTKSPKDIVEENFAAEVAEILNKQNGRFKKLVIFAPGRIQAVLKKKIAKDTSEKVLHFIEKDYTKTSEEELRKHVIELLSPK